MAGNRIKTAQVAAANPAPPVARARRAKPAGHEALLARMQTAPEADAGVLTVAAAVLNEASRAGLLDSATEHVSFRVPKALLDAAKEETGLASTTDLGLVAFAALARPDPVSEAMRRTRGKLGKQHTLEY